MHCLCVEKERNKGIGPQKILLKSIFLKATQNEQYVTKMVKIRPIWKPVSKRSHLKIWG
jgi:hypothetical protein